jgi:hypothetical protein
MTFHLLLVLCHNHGTFGVFFGGEEGFEDQDQDFFFKDVELLYDRCTNCIKLIDNDE